MMCSYIFIQCSWYNSSVLILRYLNNCTKEIEFLYLSSIEGIRLCHLKLLDAMFLRQKSMAPMRKNICDCEERLQKIAVLSELLISTANSRATVEGTRSTILRAAGV